MKQERLPLRKDHYLFITFISHDGKQQRSFRTNMPVRIEKVGADEIPAYHVVQCDIYTYCDYWLHCNFWEMISIENY